MKCLQISETGHPAFAEIPMPQLSPNDILIRTKYVGYCGSDLTAYRMQSPMAKYPLIPGHEICGEIAETGAEVPASFQIGDLVTVRPYFCCDTCSACKRGRTNACRDNHTLGVQIPGAMCEYIAIPYDHVIPCPDFPAPELIALIEPLAVGFHLNNRCKTGKGDYVAVFGCGTIGLGAIAAASYAGAVVIGVDIDDQKLETARLMGAQYVVNSRTNDAVQEILNLTGGHGCDIALEAAGTPITFRCALDAVCFAGRIGIVSYMKQTVEINTKLIVSKELDICGSRNALAEFGPVSDMIRANPDRFRALITKIYPFSEAIRALQEWDANPAAVKKILIDMSDI